MRRGDLRPRLGLRRALRAAVGVVWVTVAACSSGGGGSAASLPDQSTTEVTGSVSLPDGVGAAQVVNTLDVAPVVDGGFTVTQLASGRQLAIALSASGEPLLMGWLGPEHATLDARSTAEVLAWTAIAGFTAPPGLAPRLQQALDEAPELDPVADAVDAALSAQPEGLVDPDTGLKAALGDAAQALLAPEGAAAFIPNALLVNPADGESGIRIDQASGFNQITLVNTYRRPAYAFVDRVSVVKEQGEEASPAEIARVEVPAVQGLAGGVGTISQILDATQAPGGFAGSQDVAYVPRSLPPISVPNVEGARRTRYRVAVVGAGPGYGDFGELTETERGQQEQTTFDFTIKDILLPLTLNVLVPSSDLDGYLGHELIPGLVQDLGSLIATQIPAVRARIKERDPKGAIAAIVNAVGSSGTVRDVVFDLIRERLYDLSTEAGDQAFSRAAGAASKFAVVSGALDTASTAIDTSMILTDIARSSAGDIWTVDVADGVVHLTPETETVSPGGQVTLTAKVVDAGDEVKLEYRFHTSGPSGTLHTATGSGQEVQSSDPYVTFDALEPGKAEVFVDVHQIDRNKRPYVGSAKATITVEGSGLVITPANEEVEPFGSVALTAKLYAGDVPESLRVKWSLDGAGTLDGEAAVDTTISDADSHTVTFGAGFMPGDTTVTARMYRPGEGGAEDELIDEGTTAVTVKPFVVKITPLSSDVGAGKSQALTATVTPAAPDGTFTYAWTLDTDEGLIDGDTAATDTSSDATSSVTYQAVDDPQTCVQQVGVSVTYSDGEQTTEPRTTQATLRVDCPAEVSLTPYDEIIGVDGSTSVTASVSGGSGAGDFTYVWSLGDDSAGSLTLPGGGAVTDQPVAAAAVVFHATPTTGFMTIAVEVHDQSGEQVLATATTVVNVTDAEIYEPGAYHVNDPIGVCDWDGVTVADVVFVCRDLGTPYLRVEYHLPAWTPPGSSSELPAGTITETGPPFEEDYSSFVNQFGAPEEGYHWLAHYSWGACVSQSFREAFLERVAGASIACFGTYSGNP